MYLCTWICKQIINKRGYQPGVIDKGSIEGSWEILKKERE